MYCQLIALLWRHLKWNSKCVPCVNARQTCCELCEKKINYYENNTKSAKKITPNCKKQQVANPRTRTRTRLRIRLASRNSCRIWQPHSRLSLWQLTVTMAFWRIWCRCCLQMLDICWRNPLKYSVRLVASNAWPVWSDRPWPLCRD